MANIGATSLTLATVIALFGQQPTQSEIIERSVCQILQDPSPYNGKIVRVRGRILFAFESFELAPDGCANQKDGIWLEYGRGPKRQPTIWCCGDMTPRDPLKLVQDRSFRIFHRYLKAQARKPGCKYEDQCPRYEVTATLTGRLDVGEKNSGVETVQFYGFGHFGIWRVRLVIKSVSDVTAKDISDRYPLTEQN